MNDDFKAPLILVSLAIAFLSLAAAFRADLWGRPDPLTEWPTVDAAFTNTATVRMSAAELIKSGGDASGLDCYACHEKGKTPKVVLDEKGQLTLPDEHKDLVMQHGRHSRNIHCFNCHDPENLDSLKTRDGRNLKWEQSTELCASCHGPTYRDWEIGIHGRTSGHWDRTRGPITRVQCASCHHPHAPAFPTMAPAPGPHRLHDKESLAAPEHAEGEKKGEH